MHSAPQGWQPSLVAPFAIVDVGSALNAPAVSLPVPRGMQGRTPSRADETVQLVAIELDDKGSSV